MTLVREKPALGYVAAVVISLGTTVVLSTVQLWVGYIPLLFLPAILLVARFAGIGPGILAVLLCTAASWLLMGNAPHREQLEEGLELVLLPAVGAMVLYLLETRRRGQLLESEKTSELSILLESMPEAVLIFDREGRVQEVNGAAEELAAQARVALIGRRVEDFASKLQVETDGRRVPLPELAVVRALRGEPVRNQQRVFHRAGEQPIEAIVSANAIRGPEGEILGALVVIRDITEISMLHRRMEESERHLAVGQMAAGMAHDFNNVLDTISQSAALLDLKGEAPAADRQVYVNMILNAVGRGSEMIARVREYIRGGTGEPSAVDVRAVLEESLDLTRPLWQQHQELTVRRELQPVPAVRANAADLRRVFTNLIINALQAMPGGGTLTAHCESRNGEVAAWIEDTGLGIPPEQQKKIFSPYFTTKAGGTGLGLSGSQKIVLAHGGNISFTSEPGQGTRFTVKLPASQRDEMPRAA
jgi:PAS domain S-box-containing protein